MSRPFFSIILPSFNSERTLQRALNSIFDQKFADFEIIIVDGMSTDNTVVIAKENFESDERVRYISEKDNGVYDAMNKGIDLARGSWLYFLGSDDFFYSDDVLQQVSDCVNKTSAMIVYGNVWYEQYERVYDGIFTIEKIITQNICHQSVFYKKEVFSDVGRYNLKYKHEADYDLNLHCWLKGIKTQFIPLTVAFYSKGGLSDHARDASVVEDYPELTINYLMESKTAYPKLISHLAKVFRKILLRYPRKRFAKLFFQKGNYFIKTMGFLWMVAVSPVYYVKYLFISKYEKNKFGLRSTKV
jgi:glycosyltransferase involved in cell wall biosynthesis